MLSRILAAAAVSCALAAASAAQERSISIDTRFVDYDDPEEVTELYNLIVRTASRICTRMYEGSRWRSLSSNRREALVSACTTESVDNTIAEVRQPALSELHVSRPPVGRGRGRVTIVVRQEP